MLFSSDVCGCLLGNDQFWSLYDSQKSLFTIFTLSMYFFYGVDVNSMFHSLYILYGYIDIPHLSYRLNSCSLHLLAAESDSVTHSLLHLPPGTRPKCLASSLLYIRNRSVHHASEIAANEKSKYLNYV